MLSKEEKLICYREALEAIRVKRMQEKDVDGICVELYWASLKYRTEHEEYWVFESDKLQLWFPEFIALMPKYETIGSYWWPLDEEGNNKREEILTKLIKELEE